MGILTHRRVISGRFFSLSALAFAVMVGATGWAAAEGPTVLAGEQQSDKNNNESYSYNIPAGSLDSALLQFSQQSGGLQFVAVSTLTEGKVTKGLSGRYRAQDALTLLLEGSGMNYYFYSATSFTLIPQSNPTPIPNTDAHVLSAVRVEGDNARVIGGGNGSTDVTATEGSGSYNASTLSIGTKMAQSVRETPLSVSALSHEQIKDQRVTDITGALDKIAGVSLIQGERSDQVKFFSRAKEITRIQIDGGAPLSIEGISSKFAPSFDMSLYDHVELLRGADGLFNGNGEAGGVVNLVRKRPLDHNQFSLESSAASWDKYRNVVDVTGPLTEDGGVRGRAVATWEKRRFFYDGAHSEKKIAFASIETDITPDTQWRVGGSYTDAKSNPFLSGLPRYSDGRDLNLPRNFSTVLPWTHVNTKTLEYFTQIDHRFSDNWSGTLNVTRLEQREDNLSGSFSGIIDNNGDGLAFNRSFYNSKNKQTLLDGSLNGQFDWWGLPQKLTVGGNYKRLTSSYIGPETLGRYLATGNVFNFQSSDWPVPTITEAVSSPYNEEQAGGYAAFTFTPWQPLHFMVGARYNYYMSEDFSTPNVTRYQESQLQGPSYAISYDISPSLTAYASYTDINKSQAALRTKAGQPLDPVLGSNKEAGIKYGDAARSVTLSVYQLKQRNMQSMTEFDFAAFLRGDMTCCYINNRDEQISEGVDLEFSGELLEGWQLSANYTYNRSKYKGKNAGGIEGTPLRTQVPSQMMKLWSSYQLSGNPYLDRLKVGGGMKAQTKSYNAGTAVAQDEVTRFPFSFTQGFYADFSAFANYQIDKNWSVAVNVNNLFDRRYYQTVGSSTSGNWYAEPRNVVFTLYGQF
ncbi:TonB-dependent siderophore receptor [Pectobacterium polaris]|uniref:TonB-dependent siderophore receptor n=1 Tax=Pectobacterium polaris TaxID=2042057 RepID=UPI001CF3199E|nr:TonB-dependent receptor [Pectobacterium polaris]MCA6951099.1 TonB-dependent receptor [Pectobacterium polaris]